MLLTKKKIEFKNIELLELYSSIPEVLRSFSRNYPNVVALNDKYTNVKYTYQQFNNVVKDLAAGLQTLGVQKGDHVCLFSENNAKWMVADQAILLTGAVNAVRGAQAPLDELVYIYEHSDSKALFVENIELLHKLKGRLNSYKVDFVIVLSDEELFNEDNFEFKVFNYRQLLELGKNSNFVPVSICKNDLATMIYTSGTTGNPKGVMLTHGNIISQIKNFRFVFQLKTGDVFLNILPTWHAYERTCEYFVLSVGGSMVYTNLHNFKNDIKKNKPNFIVSVPRLWESIYQGIMAGVKKQPVRKQKLVNFFLKNSEVFIKSRRILDNLTLNKERHSFLEKVIAFSKYLFTYLPHKIADKLVYSKFREGIGGRLKQGISGGGALAAHLEDFFEIVGINITVGYGLTESSPVLTFRLLSRNYRGSAGRPIPETEIKVVNPETFEELPSYNTGLVLARGPQVMSGYYKDKEATDKVILKDNWLNTGDLGWLNNSNELILTGRAKDIIVLSNGENVEPQPIEEALLKSPFIDQVVVVGQDKSQLGALVTPNIDEIENWLKENKIVYCDKSDLSSCSDIQKLLKKEVSFHSQSRGNFRPFEKVQKVKVLNEHFTIENGLLTQTMKIKKKEVQKRYNHLIEEMFLN